MPTHSWHAWSGTTSSASDSFSSWRWSGSPWCPTARRAVVRRNRNAHRPSRPRVRRHRFRGWQVQPDAPTVQGAVLEAARRFLGADARVTGASRTDAGVHALRQTASLSTEATLAPAAVQAALNAALPPSVRVLDAREAPADFD